MNITSYFIGILLDSAIFDNLFSHLNEYIEKNNLQDSILLQNKLSLHITLYYLRKALNENEISTINEDIKHSDSKNLKNIKINSINYFLNGNKKILCYLECSNKINLKKINTYFSNKYKHSDVIDNSYIFLPHISLFKIKNSKKFDLHESNIQQIITKELKLINNLCLFKSINLFMVNSETEPETQTPV